MERGGIEIVALPKEKWKGVPIPLVTRSDSYYDLEMSPLDRDGCTVTLVRKFDTCCYTNNDIGRREVRINFGYFFHRDERRF